MDRPVVADILRAARDATTKALIMAAVVSLVYATFPPATRSHAETVGLMERATSTLGATTFCTIFLVTYIRLRRERLAKPQD